MAGYSGLVESIPVEWADNTFGLFQNALFNEINLYSNILTFGNWMCQKDVKSYCGEMANSLDESVFSRRRH